MSEQQETRVTFNRNCKIHLAASKDCGRYAFQDVKLGPDYLEATDGRMLARVPAQHEGLGSGDTLLPADVFKAATRGVRSGDAEFFVGVNGSTCARVPDGKGGSQTMMQDNHGLTFPDCQPLFADTDKAYQSGTVVDVRLNPRLLAALAQALGGWHADPPCIRLRMIAGEDGRVTTAIKVDGPEGAYGLLMPIMS